MDGRKMVSVGIPHKKKQLTRAMGYSYFFCGWMTTKISSNTSAELYSTACTATGATLLIKDCEGIGSIMYISDELESP